MSPTATLTVYAWSPWLCWCSPEIYKYCWVVLAYSCIIHTTTDRHYQLNQYKYCWTILIYTITLYAHDRSSLILLMISVMDINESNCHTNSA